MQGTKFTWCAGPAASMGAWPLLEETRPERVVSPPARVGVVEALTPRDPLRECLRNAQAALAAGQLEVALGWFRHASALNEALCLPRIGAALCLIQLGREGDGAAELAHAYATSGKAGEVDATLARMYLLGGERNAAFDAVRLAVEQDGAWAQSIREDRAFRGFVDHPMFLQALGEI